MTTENPYEAPGAVVGSPMETAPKMRLRSGPGWPLGVIALVAWIFPGGFMLTYFITVLSGFAVFGRRQRRAIVPMILGAVGALLYFLSLPF